MEGNRLEEEKKIDAIWEEYEEIVDRFIQVISKNMSLYGITPSIGRLFGVLYFSNEPMTLDDMREALKMSKTSMSTGVRTLADLRMVETTFKKGIRKDLYKTEEDWFKSFTSLFGSRWRYQTQSNIEEAREAIKALERMKEETTNGKLKEQLTIDMERLAYAKDYYEWLMQFIHVVETGEIFDLIPR